MTQYMLAQIVPHYQCTEGYLAFFRQKAGNSELSVSAAFRVLHELGESPK